MRQHGSRCQPTGNQPGQNRLHTPHTGEKLRGMAQDQFTKGLATIRTALESALSDRGVSGGVVNQKQHGTENDPTEFSITVGDKTESQLFERKEIEDSALAIDAPAAIKVRMMVGPFVR